MTDSPDTGAGDPGRASDDEVVSAYLDGAATPAEIERVESEPALAARLDRFAEISARVRDAPAAPPGVVDGHLATALADFEAAGAAAPTGAPATEEAPEPAPSGPGSPEQRGTVIDRRDRRFWQRPLGAVAAAAAVVLVVVGVIGLVGSTDDRDAADTASRSLPGALDDTGGAGTAATGEEAFDAAPTAPEAATAQRLRFSSDETLADYLRDQLDARATTGAIAEDGDTEDGDTESGAQDDLGTGQGDGADASEAPVASAPPDVGDPDPCDAVDLLGLDPDTVVTVVPVLVEDRPVTAVVHEPEDARRLVVVDDETCTVTVDREL